jgi:hypothetical protein
MKNPHLFAEFERRVGPLTPVPGARGAGGGAVRQLFRRADGKTIRYRGNMDRCLITRAIEADDVFDVDSELVIEGKQDFIGFAYPEKDGTIACYLIPSDRAVAGLKDGHKRWVEKTGGKSHLRALFFYDAVGGSDQPYYGWQRVFAEFRLSERNAEEASPPPAAEAKEISDDLKQYVAKFRRGLIKRLGGGVVHITVDATGTGNLLFHL